MGCWTRRLIGTAWVLSLGGCSSGGGGGALDAGSAGTPPDAAPNSTDGPPSCDFSTPFDAPTLVPVINSTLAEHSATLSADELTIYFVRGTFHVERDIYKATRAHRTDPFSVPTKVPGLSSEAEDVGLALTPDGRTAILESYIDVGGPRGIQHLFASTRPSVETAFGRPALVSEVASAKDADGEPYLVGGGSILYFASSRTDGHFAIYRAPRTQDGAFESPEMVLGIDAPDRYDGHPVVTEDQRTIYFASGRLRDATAGLGYATDVFVAHRAQADTPFDPPTLVTELTSTAYFNYPSWLSPDGCRIYLTSSRKGGPGPGDDGRDPNASPPDIWMAERRSR